MKIIKSILTFTMIFILVSCNKEEGKRDKIFTADDNYFLYNINEQIYNFDIADNGILYYTTQYVNEVDKENKISVDNTLVSMNLNGEIINKTVFEGHISEQIIAYKNDLIYFWSIDNYKGIGDNRVKIFTINPTSGEVSVVCVLENYVEVKNMMIINDIIYFIGIELSATGKDYSLYKTTDEFFYYGEIVSCYDLNTGVFNDMYTELPINISKTSKDNIMIYAYDENAGYFFQEYDISKKSFGEKLYKSLTDLRDFETEFILTDNNEEIIYQNFYTINLSKFKEENNLTTMLVDDSAGKSFILKSGYLLYITETDIALQQNIRRISLDEYINSPLILNMGYTEKNYFPESFGFFINQSELDYNNFLLSVLSGDKNIDFYLINSRHGFVDNIREKGAYYPLNDVSGVSEYINKMFPYLKDSAIKENGDIWMVPISLNTESITYNEKVWQRYDIDLKKIDTIEKLIDTLYEFKQNNIDESYWLNPYSLVRTYFYQLIAKNNGFDKTDFEKMAEFCYEKMNYIKNPDYLKNETTKSDYNSRIGGLLNSSSIKDSFEFIGFGMMEVFLNIVVNSTDYVDYEMALEDSNRTSTSLYNYKFLRHKNLPPIENFNKNEVTIEFFYVNPNSKNLDTVLEYISAYCKEKINERNSFILKDKSTYDNRVYINDFYDIYNSDNYVSFGLSGDLFFEDFEKFLGDEITIDEYLDRVEYKINAYINE